MFDRIAVVNRGGAALRLIRAVRELNAEHGARTRVVALHTEAERRATFVRAADEAVLLDENLSGSPYLDQAELARALRTSGADAAWVGWGFVAEDPAFAELCGDLGVTFVGPSPEAMRLFGDAVAARALAERVGVPVAPGSHGPVSDLSDGGRHLTVQVVADQHGTIWAPGVRECSVRRGHQPVLEESSSPALTADQDAALREWAIALVRAAGYVGAGTVGFRYQPRERLTTFLEVTTGLQVGHPVTEVTTGVDLVKLQLHVAAGGRLEGDPPATTGHAVQARLTAQDAEQGFAPSPGRVELLRLPTGPGVRVDTGISVGDVLPRQYDSTIATVVGFGRDRSEAVARLRCALQETTVVVRGGTTDTSFLLDLLDRPDVKTGSADTGWSDRPGTADGARPAADAWVALVQVAIDSAATEDERERVAFLASARGGRPRAPHEVGRTVVLGLRGQVYRLAVATVDSGRHRVELDGRVVDVEVDRISPMESRLAAAGRRYSLVVVDTPGAHLVEVDGATHRLSRDVGQVVRAPHPAVVVAVRAQVGDEVEVGQPIVVLESMKMEMAVRAPFTGRVREVRAEVNSQVDAGAALLSLEPTGGPVEAATGERAELPTTDAVPEADPGTRARAVLTALRALVTGYDVSGAEARRLVAEYAGVRDRLPVDDPGLLHGELGVLTVFADICELSRNRPASDEEEADTQVHSPREYFHSFLRSLDVEQEALPESFRTRLRRALRHYGVEDLEPGPDLVDAVHRIFLSQQRIGEQLPAVLALLDRRLTADRLPEGPARAEVGEVLDRLVVATQLRYPAVGDLARAVRYRYFEEPVVQQARQRVLDDARRLLEELDPASGDTAEQVRRMEALVASPEPLIRLLAQRIGRQTAVPDLILEALTRRYYRSRSLEDVRSSLVDGHTCVTAEYDLNGTRLHLVALMAGMAQLPAALVALTQTLTAADPTQLVVDLYVDWPGRPADADELSDSLHGLLAGVPALRTGRRVTVTVSSPGGDVETLTFRPSPDGSPVEERDIRGLHPLSAQRLNLWRLKHFDGQRVPSAEDTYLFHVTGKDNPDDERFIAMAEVRDLTPLRDDEGRIVGFPTVQRQLTACLDSLRRAQSLRRSRRPLEHNRLYLYAWPSIEVPVSQVATFARTSAPLTLGAGLDQIVLLARLQEEGRPPREVAVRFSSRSGTGMRMEVTDRPSEPMRPLDDYTAKVLSSRARGAPYPYELAPLLAGPGGSFVEHELDADGRLAPVERLPGRNAAGIVVGLVTTPTQRYPEGMTRVALLGDPTKALGTVAEPECARVVAALDLAEERGIPVEWFALSSGARISMDSGTENMDWVSRALRRIIEFTQSGGEINVVVTGINVGAQPYWNAEATMLMHTKGILVMTPDSAMVLTGKHSLDYSGGVSAEDNFGIGGYDRVMGPNGQAQYWAPDLTGALDVLRRHYDHTYRVPGERWARPAETSDPRDRDVRSFPHEHAASEFTTVGDVFSAEKNPDRKKAFDIRTVMRAVTDQDHPVLERWAGMADADTAVVLDAHLGGHPVAVLGIESRPIPRRGSHPADGPDVWTAGTLFPRSSKKTARAINAASGNRPLVVLANLSGFDGSPESLREMQLEYGAEIGRAITNFDGPIVFCVVSRYHGGAFVVFSGVLNDGMEVLAVEGSYASVIGGTPAAAVVFSREVDKRTAADPRVRDLEAQPPTLRGVVRSEKLGEVAAEFEAVHDIERARRTGSVHAIIPAAELRPRLIDAVERGMERATRTGTV